GPASAPWATMGASPDASPQAASAPWAAPSAAPARRRAPLWPWIVAAVIVAALGGMGLLAAVLVFGAFAAVTQVAQGAGEGFTAAFEMTLWDSARAPIVADADGDGDEDLIGSVMTISGSGDSDTSFAAF